MKKSFRYFIATALAVTATSAVAQELNSAYFIDDFKYRHDLNAAFGNEQNYVAMPTLGNINVGLKSNFGLDAVLFENKWGGKKTTTFMNPNIPVDEALKGFDSGENKLITDIRVTLLSTGFKMAGGYSTIELSSKTSIGMSLPYELFEFAKDVGNRTYDIGDIDMRGHSYLELAFGHSRPIDEKLRGGIKLKVLFGVARATVKMKDMKADLSNTGDVWTMSGSAQADVNMKGFNYKMKSTDYNTRPGSYQHINDVDVDGTGISGLGTALDLGFAYKVNDDLTISAGVNDLGFINWSNDMRAKNTQTTFTFEGFRDLEVHTGTNSNNSATIDDRLDSYEDQLADFANLQDMGDLGAKTHLLAPNINVGLEYSLPQYRQFTIGLLGSTRLNGKYSWYEGRLSANVKPLPWLDGGINGAYSTFGGSFGWIINIHPKAVNFFVGMDHVFGEVSKQMVPLSANANVAVGLNFAW